jgi:hypothetical protein
MFSPQSPQDFASERDDRTGAGGPHQIVQVTLPAVFLQTHVNPSRAPSSGPCTGTVSCRRSSSLQEAVSTSESSERLYRQLPMFVTYLDSKRLRLGPRALRCHRTRDGRGEVPALGPFSPVFRWLAQYDHSRHGICNSEADLCAFQCRPGIVSFLRGVREGGRQQLWIISSRLGEGRGIYSTSLALDVKRGETVCKGKSFNSRRLREGITTLHDHSVRHCNRRVATDDWRTESGQQSSPLENSF